MAEKFHKKRAYGQVIEAQNAYNNAYNQAQEAGNAGFTNAQGALNSAYDKTSAAYAPYLQGGQQAYDMLQDLMGVPREGVDVVQAKQQALDALRNTPGYQFKVNQANDQLQRLAAQRGMSFSGNELADLSELNQGLADQGYQGALQSYYNMAFNPLVQPGINNMAQYGEDSASLGLNQGMFNSNLLREKANTNLGLGQMRAQIAGMSSGRGGGGFLGALGGLAGSIIGSMGGPIGSALGNSIGNWAGNAIGGGGSYPSGGGALAQFGGIL
jgi:hypothetical protein